MKSLAMTFDDTVAHMTTKEQMRDNVLWTLKRLDETLPADSHVLMIGLADGTFLWNSLHNRYHPIGMLNKDIKYPQFYKYLSCVGCNTCNGWLTSNETLREFTSQRAWELSQVLKQLANSSSGKYRNIDVHYMDCPLTRIIEEWELAHGPDTGYQLIEPVDGFHPNQLGNVLLAEYIWKHLEQHLPHYIGDINPHNQKIIDIFGDQGGY
jgi:acyloxyacyl hydrolase